MKYRYLLIIFGLLQLNSAFGQLNLVPNPSFEEKDSCPSGQYALTPRCEGWYDPVSIMPILPGTFYTYKDWGAASYYNICNNTTVGVPENVAGIQEARSGDAYSGTLIFANAIWINVDRYMAYISIELNSSLKKGQTYYAEFHYSLAEGTSNDDPNAFLDNLYFVELGMLFTDSAIIRGLNTATEQPLNTYETPQVKQMMGTDIDTLNWIKVSGTFIAKGGEKHLTIGSFKEVDTTSQDAYTYIFIDDVAVIEEYTPPVLPTDDVKLFPNPSNDNIIWVSSTKGYLDNSKLYIYDEVGRLVYSFNFLNGIKLHRLDLNHLNSGMYFYSIEKNDEIIQKGKLVLL